MAWALIIVAGFFETIFAICLKLSEGFSRLWPTLGFLGASVISFTLLSIGMRTLPVGSAYAVWTGIGAAGTATVGMAFLNDPTTLLRISAIMLILSGVILLNLTSGSAS